MKAACRGVRQTSWDTCWRFERPDSLTVRTSSFLCLNVPSTTKVTLGRTDTLWKDGFKNCCRGGGGGGGGGEGGNHIKLQVQSFRYNVIKICRLISKSGSPNAIIKIKETFYNSVCVCVCLCVCVCVCVSVCVCFTSFRYLRSLLSFG